MSAKTGELVTDQAGRPVARTRPVDCERCSKDVGEPWSEDSKAIYAYYRIWKVSGGEPYEDFAVWFLWIAEAEERLTREENAENYARMIGAKHGQERTAN